MSHSPIARILLLPSALCLDAPLVAAGWAMLLSTTSESTHPPALAALFFAVWAIYLADRIRDSHVEKPDDETFRHHFARDHRKAMVVLLAAAILGGNFAALSGLKSGTMKSGMGVAVATACYFLVIGWQKNKPPARHIPFKEIAIAICFAIGVKIGAGSPLWKDWLSWDTLALTSLFLTNCLVISKAETSRDRRIDPHAFFAASLDRSKFWIVIPALLTIVLGMYLAFNFCPGVGISLIVCSACLTWIQRWPEHRFHWVQAASDGALLLPWIAVAFS